MSIKHCPECPGGVAALVVRVGNGPDYAVCVDCFNKHYRNFLSEVKPLVT